VKQKKAVILQVLNGHRLMALATNRPDGWPQVTTVGYVNDGFLLYCFVAHNSQKHTNIRRDPRVSIAIGSDNVRPLDIKGLSLAAQAHIVTDRGEIEYVSQLRLLRYPEYSALSVLATDQAAARIAPGPTEGGVVLLRLVPELITLIDYSQGFGHSDLVTFSERDLEVHVARQNHQWGTDAIR